MVAPPFPIFIGSEPGHFLPAELLRFSISSSTQHPVTFHELKFQNLPFNVRVFSGFFIYRFAVPELCGYKGRALYLDSNLLAFSDLSELFKLDMKGKGALACPLHIGDLNAGRYTGIMLLDCEKLSHWKVSEWVDKMQKDPSIFTKTLKALPGGFATQDFGDLPEIYRPSETKSGAGICSYTLPASDIGKEGTPLPPIFLSELKRALQEGAIPLDVLQQEMSHGRVHSDLLKRLDLL